jgi:hypothetical protein
MRNLALTSLILGLSASVAGPLVAAQPAQAELHADRTFLQDQGVFHLRRHVKSSGLWLGETFCTRQKTFRASSRHIMLLAATTYRALRLLQ